MKTRNFNCVNIDLSVQVFDFKIKMNGSLRDLKILIIIFNKIFYKEENANN